MLLEKLNPHIILDSSLSLRYNNAKALFVVNVGVLSYSKTRFVLDKDGVKTIILYYDDAEGESIYTMNKHSSRTTKTSARNFWSSQQEGDVSDFTLEELLTTDADLSEISGNETDPSTLQKSNRPKSPLEKEPIVVCSITTIEDWDLDKFYKTQRGIRHTYVQGYNEPLDFYSPVYSDGTPSCVEDYRRTLYWSPDVKANENCDTML